VLLQVMALTRDIAHDFIAVGQADLGDLTKRRVRLFRGRGVNARANATALRARLKSGNLVPLRLVFPRLADELVNCGHQASIRFLFRFPVRARAVLRREYPAGARRPGSYVRGRCSKHSFVQFRATYNPRLTSRRITAHPRNRSAL